jgi:delta-aminolevulinic acid dehydratase/porphobilinogen synthase
MNTTIADITKALREHVASKYGKQCVAAAEWGVTSAMVSQVLNGRKRPNQLMLDDAGIERVVTVAYRAKDAA